MYRYKAGLAKAKEPSPPNYLPIACQRDGLKVLAWSETQKRFEQ